MEEVLAGPNAGVGHPEDAASWAVLDQYLGEWSRHKQCYRFDPDLAADLVTADVADVPLSILERLPFPCIAVESRVPGLTYGLPSLQGFVAWVGHGAHEDFLGLVLLHDDGWGEDKLPFSRHPSIADFPTVDPEEDGEDGKPLITAILSLLLYLVSQSADVVPPVPMTGAVRRQVRRGLNAPMVWEAGARVGAAMRAQEAVRGAAGGPGEGTGRTLRPHHRAGHWQRYRCGPKDDWHYELRYILPMLVGDPSRGDPATLHDVRA